MNKKVVAIVVAIVVIIGAVCGWYFGYKKPYDTAVANYNAAVANVEALNAEYDSAVSSLQALVDSGETPYDEATLTAAQDVLSGADAVKVEIPEMPEKTKDIVAVTEELNKPLDYSNQISSLQDAEAKLSESIEIYKLVNNPGEDRITSVLEKISGINGMAVVTEDHDPNGNLHKAGGYTACVYFSHESLNVSAKDEYNIIEEGTDGGGCIEVYETPEDAQKRADYLSGFDGTIFASGTHTVCGTVLVRTSNELTATQQKELEEAIINQLITP